MIAVFSRIPFSQTVSVDDVADFIIVKCVTANVSLNNLKLQKLVYYAQAWRLAFTGHRLFNGELQAWVHGPVNRELFDRFNGTKSLYSEMTLADVRPGFNPEALPTDVKGHLNSVLESYANLTGSQLEEMTHAEEPWRHARLGFGPADRCAVAINEQRMSEFYKARLG